MRYMGRKYSGARVTIAIIDSGINTDDPRLLGAHIEGWAIELNATGHALLHSDFSDEQGNGTQVAAVIHDLAPDALLLAVKLISKDDQPSAELIAAGLETVYHNGIKIANLSLCSDDMAKSLLLRDCCVAAEAHGTLVIAAAHPQGERAYPADFPETVGVSSHQDCPPDKFYFFEPARFPRKEWGPLSGKFLASGQLLDADGYPSGFLGPGIATAYMSGRLACLAQALPGQDIGELVHQMERLGLIPNPEIGYL